MSLMFLIGMPGSGKSSLARLWARSYNWQVIDMDQELVERHGSIAGIFRLHGEDYFREKEQALLHDLIRNHPEKTIISTGGGTPCFFDNLEQMKASGCVIYIKATLEELNQRLKETTVVRPLLAGNKDEKLRDLLATRASIYENAHVTYPIESLTEATFAEIIDTCTNRR